MATQALPEWTEKYKKDWTFWFSDGGSFYATRCSPTYRGTRTLAADTPDDLKELIAQETDPVAA